MHRNLSTRVEVVTPLNASSARQRLWEVLDVCLRDLRHAWVMGSDGRYTQLRPESGADGPERLGTHQMLIDLTTRRSLAAAM